MVSLIRTRRVYVPKIGMKQEKKKKKPRTNLGVRKTIPGRQYANATNHVPENSESMKQNITSCHVNENKGNKKENQR
ncbi:hypothetical protein IF2G_00537 [Cordyceps javanica]|nr:hypothetical protein IF2G_00537 [Cordyceps javanica]